MKVRVDPASEHLAMRRVGVNPHIPNFGSRCHWAVSCMLGHVTRLQGAHAFSARGGWMDVRASLGMVVVNTNGMPEIRPCVLLHN